MSLFVHITSDKNVDSILRSGIKFEKRKGRREDHIYAVPVTSNFFISHQWLRELKRQGNNTFVGIYFRIPDDEEVKVSHYGELGPVMTASRAEGLIRALEKNDPIPQEDRYKRPRDPLLKGIRPGVTAQGFEVRIGRRIAAKEIVKVRSLPQVLGWRYAPEAHGNAPRVCMCCDRGAIRFQKLIDRVNRAEAKGKPLSAVVFMGDKGIPSSLRR